MSTSDRRHRTRRSSRPTPVAPSTAVRCSLRRATGLPLAGALSLAMLTACGDGTSPPADPVTVRDSAGIAIVESTAPRWGPGEGWTVEPVPVLDLTETGGPPAHEFERVADVVALPAGGYAVADAGWREIRYFDDDGTHLRTVGREGEGPGEFRRLHHLLVLPGDSLAAVDTWLRRMAVYGPDGELGRMIRFPSVNSMGLDILPEHGFLAHGVSFSLNDEEIEPGLQRSPAPMLRLAPDGSVRDTVAEGAGFEHVVLVRDGEIAGDAGAFFWKTDHVEVHEDLLYMGSADSLAYEVRTLDGELRRLVRVPGFDLSVPPELLDAEIEARRERGGPLWEMRDQIPEPTSLPAYSEMIADAGGNVWLEAFLAPTQADRPRTWRVFDPEGAWLGEVVLPARFTVHEITDDRVLGVWTDSLDVQRPRVLRLNRASGPG